MYRNQQEGARDGNRRQRSRDRPPVVEDVARVDSERDDGREHARLTVREPETERRERETGRRDDRDRERRSSCVDPVDQNGAHDDPREHEQSEGVGVREDRTEHGYLETSENGVLAPRPHLEDPDREIADDGCRKADRRDRGLRRGSFVELVRPCVDRLPAPTLRPTAASLRSTTDRR